MAGAAGTKEISVKWALLFLLLTGCCNPKKPTTYTVAPGLTGAKHSVADAKDMVVRAQLSNDQISKLIRELQGLKK
jgi:hypothetical protein